MNEEFKHKDLTLKTEESDKEVVVHWEGKSTERDPAVFLNPIIKNLLEKQKRIILNFKKLDYMNSSTISPLIKVLDQLKQKGGEMLIIYSKDLKWQELSFSALEIFKTGDKRIDIIGE